MNLLEVLGHYLPFFIASIQLSAVGLFADLFRSFFV